MAILAGPSTMEVSLYIPAVLALGIIRERLWLGLCFITRGIYAVGVNQMGRFSEGDAAAGIYGA